ncbi:TetR family transcriptional regulator [Ligilactobacillus salitolerans]|uniref:TetR family transcriptional regulator n=1 Tax=Ligilactobacillus salitolerans TaxID=1808352 RepID=A0A401ITL0_9LACO|nr:TetR-like C-terminal domain-containing protein [Ligilactobacillus salitolerans]GBG94835.1 TetR family transcriptional regulator [Ligilactobacillus salitolerans]
MNHGQLENKRVKEQIITAYFDLLAQKSPGSITVTEIIKKAGVARTSYYRNFYQQDDIVEYYLKLLTERLPQPTDDIMTYQNALQGFTNTLHAVRSEKKQFLLLYQTGYSQLLQAFLLDNIFAIAGDMTVADPEIYRLYFVTGAVYNLLIAWLERDTRETPEKLAAIAADYLTNGVLEK